MRPASGAACDLDEPLTASNEFQRRRKSSIQHILQMSVRGVAQRHPENLRGRAPTIEEINEVLILREHHRTSGPSCFEDLDVLCIPESAIPNGDCLDAELLAYPIGQIRRELGVDPKGQAATTR